MEHLKDDDFFGDQDDEFDDYNGSSRANPQQAEICAEREGLARHDVMAMEEKFRNIGFMEAFEASQEVNLQSGFHAGFRESESDAFRIGKMFGKLCASEALNGRESDEIKNLAKLVRVFLSDLQNSNGVDRKAPSLKEVEMKIDQAVTLENNNDEGNDND